MIARRLLIGFGLTLAAATAFAKAPQFAPAPTPRPIFETPTGAELAANAGISGEIAFLVYDLDTGEVLEARNEAMALPPASVAKVPTALYALDALGPDYRFETRVLAVGPINGGVLKGDLILQGGGDPEADTTTLDALARQATAYGVRNVQGRYLIDDGLIPAIERIDYTQPEYASYNPSISALNLNYNRVHAQWRRGANGYSMNVEARAEGLSPPTDIATVRIVEQTTSGGVFDFQPGERTEVWSVARSALGRAGSRWLPVRKPSEYASRIFKRLATTAGLRLPEAQSGAAPIAATVIARTESRPLAAITRDMLRYSTNLTAEALGLAATRAKGVAPSDLADSGTAMNVWAAAFAGFSPGDAGFRMVNHSGLSGASRATATRLVTLLKAADGRGFPGLLGGPPATLRGLLPEKQYLDDDAPKPPVGATMRAKTGTLNFTSALAGYIDTDAGKRLAFAILTADVPRREAIVNRQISRPSGSRTWGARARALQRALVRSWISRFGGASG